MFRIVLFAGLVFLSGCDTADDPADNRTTVPLSERMAAAPDPGFARALGPREFRFPADHGAHPEFATEWWYFTGNLSTSQGRAFGYQLTLFRVGLKPGKPEDDSSWRTHQLYMGHLAISDIEAGLHHSTERFSRAAAGLAGVQGAPLRIWLGPWSIRSSNDATFPLTLEASGDALSLSLDLSRGDRPMVLQGDRGLSVKGAAPGSASYYYSLTRLPTRGSITVGGKKFNVVGSSWFDREWSSSALAPDQAGWDWFALQLDDGRDLMFYRMRGLDGQAQRFSQGVLLDSDGTVHRLSADDVLLSAERDWSAEDGIRYPVGWRLRVPEHGLDLSVDAAIADQEMDHTVRYWEGAVRVAGSQSGVGYLELSGYAR